MTRREAIKQLTLASAAIVGGSQLASAQAPTPIAVYKDPNCGCCAKWVDHMKASGFTASVTETSDMNAIKTRYHVSEGLRSCHTTIAGGYVIEGHVPAADVKRLLTQKPKGIAGLAIPGMPASAPGMDGTPFASYDVLAFDQTGKTSVFAKHAKA
jgi:hypothetical protein